MSPSETFGLVLCTVPNEKLAAELARGLVENQLAACVNMIPGIRSFYRWQGQVHDDLEVQLFIKTRVTRIDELSAWIKTHHPYEVPEILLLPIMGGSEDYLRWVWEQTTVKSY